MRILIVKPSSLGDVFHTLPAAEMIARALPGAEIDWLIHPAFVEALEYCRNLRRPIIFPREKLGRISTFFPALLGMTRELRGEHYDAVVDFQGLLRSAMCGWLASSKRYAGFAEPREKLSRRFYSESHRLPPDYIHAVDRNCGLAAAVLGIDYQRGTALPPLPDNPRAAAEAEELLSKAGLDEASRFVCVVAGARWESKRWPEAFFAAVMRQVLERLPDVKFVMLGSRGDAAVNRRVMENLNHPGVVDLAGLTGISSMVEVVRRSVAMLSNDSGPMHVAAALNVPVFAMFGPTDPDKTGPHGNIHQIVKPMLPCLKCLRRTCPRDESVPCHGAVDPRHPAELLSSYLLEH